MFSLTTRLAAIVGTTQHRRKIFKHEMNYMRSYESRRFKHQRKTIYVGMMVGEISDIF